ncbi:hypothetical protein [Noviherbaspirillum saxi]|uniref:Uncharacterized protein n=1 Tax=Noviherbaspirillum saxi TaxID=2320863 RepID=A0A3A3FKV6_9BURK|nr:hypothetical protein [Noviherbaspirillum saxi]RJF92142.1 hypothetical protein D3871_26225 [Noviherbaspirillum saxi]
MKIKIVFWLAALLYVNAASAEWITLRSSKASGTPQASNSTSASNSTATATTSSKGGSALGVGSQGQSLSIDSHAVYEASRAVASTAFAPALTSSNDTCMGSISMGANAVSVGLSFGSTWTDNNCLMLKNAREMWNMGFKGAALARMCMDDLNRQALESTGINCSHGRGVSITEAKNTARID